MPVHGRSDRRGRPSWHRGPGTRPSVAREPRSRRVRVVETPLIPYIQWELTILHTKFGYGERVNVLDATEVAGEETQSPLPELCVMGTDAVYVLDHTPANEPNGAVRHTDPATVTRARTFVQRLYAAGETLDTYFPREVAGLSAPRGL
ncbi:DUF6879 family protein [Streptomyces sp. NPDC013161]|uniref:DUF6879 family protein n=1 Tax=Streptomyces sp. NPDC013161 TaxID=3364862 RepID=UPI00369A0817